MKRRESIKLLGGVTVTWPLAVHAQQSAMPVIGLLSGRSLADSVAEVGGFRRGLHLYPSNEETADALEWAMAL